MSFNSGRRYVLPAALAALTVGQQALTANDCNLNGIPDACDVACGGPWGGICDVDGCGESEDCNANGRPDECEPQEDCNDNGVQDICDLGVGTSLDCNRNGVPDECEIDAGTAEDCQPNGVLDRCDIGREGLSFDVDLNGVPDECQVCAEIVRPSGPLASLQAVAINGEPIEPTNCLAAAPGDLIEAEFFVSGWGPAIGDMRSYQVKILGRRGAVSGQFGLVLPVGWLHPLESISCSSDNDCPTELNCNGAWCFSLNHNPREGVSVDNRRDDYVFVGNATGTIIVTSTLDYLYLGLASDGEPDSGGESYAGTLLLEVSVDACGRFSYGFDRWHDQTFFANNDGGQVVPRTRSLVIETPTCDCNDNAVRDDEEISVGDAFDCDGDGVLDECEPDSDGDGVIDDCDACPESSAGETIVINGCETRVVNQVFDDGCTMLDDLAACGEEVRNHGAYVSCVARAANSWRRDGMISGDEHGRIVSCAAKQHTGRNLGGASYVKKEPDSQK